jgi:hypothetical protein
MKREILFRGYSEALNKWVEGDLAYMFNNPRNACIMPECFFATRNFGEEDENGNPIIEDTMALGGYFPVHPDSVGQFTGLCDMEGIKIFEGDVLKVGENLTCEVVYIGTNSDDYGDEINASFHAKIHQHDKVIPLDGYLKKYCKITGNTFKPQ